MAGAQGGVRAVAQAQRWANLLSPASVFTGEKGLGLLTSVASGGISAGLNYAGTAVLGLSPVVSAALFLYSLGSLLSYSFDILYAKREFQGRVLPYSAQRERWAYLLRSFRRKQFYRFVVTLVLETLVSVCVLRALIAQLNRMRVLVSSPRARRVRDVAASLAVALLVFLLFANVLRFDWAYRDEDNPTMNIVVLMWTTLVLVVFATTYAPSEDEPPLPPPPGFGSAGARALAP
jgi:hypothetical protein